jgi:hypothetical protein
MRERHAPARDDLPLGGVQSAERSADASRLRRHADGVTRAVGVVVER